MKTGKYILGIAALAATGSLFSCKESCEKEKRADLTVQNALADSVSVFYYGSFLGDLAPGAQEAFNVAVYDYRSSGDLKAVIKGCTTQGGLLDPEPCAIKGTPKILPCEPYFWKIQ